jgi:hypothetical protein
MLDSLKNVVENTQKISDNNVDIITKIDAFYNNAWNKLIILGSVLFAVVGIFVPLFIQWYQKRTMKLSENEVKIKLKKEISEDLLKEIELKFKENEKKIEMINSSANSKILFSQAKFSIEKNSYKVALSESIAASYFSMECNDYKILQEILDFIHNNCLSYLSIEEIEDLKIANICDLNLFLERLSKKDDRAIFQARIGEIKVRISKLPKLIKEKSEEKPKT